MTSLKQGLVAVPLTPGDDVKDGQCAVADNGTVWRHQGGLWHAHPWWQGISAEELIAVCADPDEWAYHLGWTRNQLEESVGALTYIRLPDSPSVPHTTTADAKEEK